MAAVENPPDISSNNSKKSVTNALESPSVRKMTKDVSEMINAFDSPSCQSNGSGDADEAIDPEKSPSIIMLQRKGTKGIDAMSSPGTVFQGVSEEAAKNAM